MTASNVVVLVVGTALACDFTNGSLAPGRDYVHPDRVR